MNEGLVFIAIIIATILQGILGALLVVLVLASVIVIGGYVQRRVLGLPPFEDDGTRQFAAPVESQPPRRKWSRKERRARLGRALDPQAIGPKPVMVNDPPPPAPEELTVEEKPQE